jgi:hypothetical protein
MEDRAMRPINKPITNENAQFLVGLVGFGGWTTFSWEEVQEYNKNPDAYVAESLGFKDVAQYAEFITGTEGHRCRALTKVGKRCRKDAIHCPTPEEWIAGRRQRCQIHK